MVHVCLLLSLCMCVYVEYSIGSYSEPDLFIEKGQHFLHMIHIHMMVCPAQLVKFLKKLTLVIVLFSESNTSESGLK